MKVLDEIQRQKSFEIKLFDFNVSNVTNGSNEIEVEVEVFPQYQLPNLEYQMTPEQKYNLEHYGLWHPNTNYDSDP